MARKKTKIGCRDFGFGRGQEKKEIQRDFPPLKIWLAEDEYAEVRICGEIIDRGQGPWQRYAYQWMADIVYPNHRLAGYPRPLVYDEFGYDKEGLALSVNADLEYLRSRVKEALEKNGGRR